MRQLIYLTGFHADSSSDTEDNCGCWFLPAGQTTTRVAVQMGGERGGSSSGLLH